MRKSSAALLLLLALVVVLVAVQVPSAQAPAAQASAPSVTVVTPDKIAWKPVPAGLPPGAMIAVLSGDPTSDGPFVLRLKMPDGYKIAPHRHPVTETTTVLSGELRIGSGDTWDDSKLQSLPPGSMVVRPARTEPLRHRPRRNGDPNSGNGTVQARLRESGRRSCKEVEKHSGLAGAFALPACAALVTNTLQ
jgi:hypothetical protein